MFPFTKAAKTLTKERKLIASTVPEEAFNAWNTTSRTQQSPSQTPLFSIEKIFNSGSCKIVHFPTGVASLSIFVAAPTIFR